MLSSQGMQANQAVTFITDGGEDVRDLPLNLKPEATHLLDWSHVTMRITVMANMAKSLRSPPEVHDFPSSPPVDLATGVGEELARLEWRWYPSFAHTSDRHRWLRSLPRFVPLSPVAVGCPGHRDHQP